MKAMFRFSLILFIGGLLFGACKKDADDDHEEELITTLTLIWTPKGVGPPVIFSFQDLDGEGGNPPIITSGSLSANTEYTVDIQLLDESKSPAENIRAEIIEEADEHQFFFATTAGVNLSYVYLDSDPQGLPLGLMTDMTTGDPSVGKLRVTLLHGLNKGAAGVKEGDPTNAGGDTDIEVDFDIVIQ